MTDADRTKWLLGLAMLAVSFAAILVRAAAAPAIALAFWRSFGGAVALVPFAMRTRGTVDDALRWRLIASGAFLAVHFALFIGSLSYTSVASAVVFAATAPLFVGIGSWLFLHQPPSRRTWTGIGIATAGAVVVGLADAGSGATGSNPVLGDLMALAGAVAVSGYLIIGQRSRERLDVATYGVWVYGTAAVVLLLMSWVLRVELVGFGTTTWLAIAGLTIGPQLLGHTVFNLVLDRVPATTVAVVALSEPIGAGVLALLFLGEVPPALLALGGPLILAGVFLSTTGGRDPVPAAPVG